MTNKQIETLIKKLESCKTTKSAKTILNKKGIETEEEAAGMQQEGVDYIQGFYYSKPLPLPEYIKFIDEQFMH